MVKQQKSERVSPKSVGGYRRNRHAIRTTLNNKYGTGGVPTDKIKEAYSLFLNGVALITQLGNTITYYNQIAIFIGTGNGGGGEAGGVVGHAVNLVETKNGIA